VTKGYLRIDAVIYFENYAADFAERRQAKRRLFCFSAIAKESEAKKDS